MHSEAAATDVGAEGLCGHPVINQLGSEQTILRIRVTLRMRAQIGVLPWGLREDRG